MGSRDVGTTGWPEHVGSTLVIEPRAAREHAGWIGRLLDDAADDWRLSSGAVIAIVLAPFVVVLMGVLAVLMGSDAYKWFVREDGFAENVQVLAFAAAAVLAFAAASRFRARRDTNMALLYGFIGLGLVFVAGEEISWGQRILGWETPAALESLNRQDETNLHNIPIIEMSLRWAKLGVGLWGFVLPVLLLRSRERVARLGWRTSLLLPHVTLAFYFAGEFVWRLYRLLGPEPAVRFRFVVAEWSEVMELNLALGILLFVAFVRRHRAGDAAAGSREVPAR